MIDLISMHRTISVFFLALGIVLLGSAQSAHASDSDSMTRAARLTFMQGTVSVAEADNPAGVPAQLNLPLLSGVQLITGSDGQAEVEFEDGSVIRLTPNSALSLDSLTVQPDGVFLSSLGLLRGLAYCELRATPQYRYTLEAGGDVLSPVENTTVRVNLDEPPATFTVFDGTAQVERQNASVGYQTQVRAGETLREDPNDASRYFLNQQIAEDSWDHWNEDRDRQATSEAAETTPVRNDYAGAQGYGWSDLDANGSWYDVPGQGPVWQPQAAVEDSGFDPYGNGAWVWYPGTGYLWASSYSWGWTPYRCGNWSYFNSFGWGWAPGSGCGGFGWGFAGGGRSVNIVTGPTGYRPIHVPLGGGPHRIQPTLPVQVKAWQRPEGSRGEQSGPRRIAGVTVQPIKPVARGPIGDDNHARSSLRRDFPIDSATRNPVLGVASTNSTVVRPNSGLHSNPGRLGNPEAPSQRQQAPNTPYNGQPYPAGGQFRGPAQTNPASSGRVDRPAQPNTPVDRGSPRPAPQPSAPGPRPAQPTYSPPPAHSTYSPPPPQAPPAVSHPTYSPPPAQAPQPASHPAGRPSPQ